MEKFLQGKENVAWLLSTHLKRRKLPFIPKSFRLWGNEDSPTQIELFREVNPHYKTEGYILDLRDGVPVRKNPSDRSKWQTTRPVTIDDMNAAIRGLHLNSAPIEDLRAYIRDFSNSEAFASRNIVAACKHVLKSKQRVGLLPRKNPSYGEMPQGVRVVVSSRKNAYGEYTVNLYVNGKRNVDAQYFTDDKDDAHSTAQDMLRRAQAAQMRTNPSTASRTRTATETATQTSTRALTRGNITVTGGAGRGATTSVTLRRNPRPVLRATRKRRDHDSVSMSLPVGTLAAFKNQNSARVFALRWAQLHRQTIGIEKKGNVWITRHVTAAEKARA